MSKKTELQADLRRIGYQLGGAHLTQQARGATFNTFAKTMGELEFGIRAAKQIGARHLQAFVAHRAAQGINPRTLANELRASNRMYVMRLKSRASCCSGGARWRDNWWMKSYGR